MRLKISIIFTLNFHPLINQIKPIKNRNEEKKKNSKNCVYFSIITNDTRKIHITCKFCISVAGRVNNTVK